jgi:hypothetical protein
MTWWNYSENWRRGTNQFGNRYDHRGEGAAEGGMSNFYYAMLENRHCYFLRNLQKNIISVVYLVHQSRLERIHPCPALDRS